MVLDKEEKDLKKKLAELEKKYKENLFEEPKIPEPDAPEYGVREPVLEIDKKRFFDF